MFGFVRIFWVKKYWNEWNFIYFMKYILLSFLRIRTDVLFAENTPFVLVSDTFVYVRKYTFQSFIAVLGVLFFSPCYSSSKWLFLVYGLQAAWYGYSSAVLPLFRNNKKEYRQGKRLYNILNFCSLYFTMVFSVYCIQFKRQSWYTLLH